MRSCPCMLESVPRRLPSFSMTTPEYSVGTSHTTRSIGSHCTPSISLYKTTGLVTWNS